MNIKTKFHVWREKFSNSENNDLNWKQNTIQFIDFSRGRFCGVRFFIYFKSYFFRIEVILNQWFCEFLEKRVQLDRHETYSIEFEI
jgi:hypothetical protein